MKARFVLQLQDSWSKRIVGQKVSKKYSTSHASGPCSDMQATALIFNQRDAFILL